MIASQSQPGEELAETLARLQRTDFELPFQARVPRDLTPKESDELLEYLGDEEIRRRMVGSFEITEILKKRFETMVSSGQWASSAGAWVTSVSSPFGASFGQERGFHMHVNAELIIYGGTEPNAQGAHRWPGHHPEQGRHVLVPLRLPGWPVPYPDRRHLGRRRGKAERVAFVPAHDGAGRGCTQDGPAGSG